MDMLEELYLNLRRIESADPSVELTRNSRKFVTFRNKLSPCLDHAGEASLSADHPGNIQMYSRDSEMPQSM